MNTVIARRLVENTARLMDIATRFEVKFGRDYQLKPGSPQEAWDLYQQAYEEQCRIAQQLDVEALEHPFIRWGQWWQRQDMIDTGIINELAAEIFHLISYCACQEANSDVHFPVTLKLAQETIAGVLHPATRQIGLDREIKTA